MREYGILFSPPMVRALLNTRIGEIAPIDPAKPYKAVTRRLDLRWLKKAKRGNVLWAREGWRPAPAGCSTVTVKYLADGSVRHFADDGIPPAWRPPKAAARGGVTSLFMPRWASRIQLECLEDARLEPLQEITEEDARLEGVEPFQMTEADSANLAMSDESPEVKAFWKVMGPGRTTARTEFEMLWSTLHAKSGERWDDNPSVVRIGKFRRIA